MVIVCDASTVIYDSYYLYNTFSIQYMAEGTSKKEGKAIDY